MKRQSDLNKRQFPLVTLTSYHREEMVDLYEERKQNYLCHIRKLIDAVKSEYDSDVQEDEKLFQTDVIIEENEQQIDQLNSEIFRVCAGRCCYLSAYTFKRK